MSDALILSAVRTPIGKYLGGLADVTAPQLGAVAIAEALKRAKAPAVLAVEGAPGIDRARDRHRMRRLHADLADAALDIPIDLGLGRSAPGTIERYRQSALPRIENETIAADPGALRLDDALHGDRRNRGIGRIAARTQHVEGSQSRRRVRGRGHAVRRHRRRSPRNIEVTHNRAMCRNVAVAPSAHRSPAVIPLVRD